MAIVPEVLVVGVEVAQHHRERVRVRVMWVETDSVYDGVFWAKMLTSGNTATLLRHGLQQYPLGTVLRDVEVEPYLPVMAERRDPLQFDGVVVGYLAHFLSGGGASGLPRWVLFIAVRPTGAPMLIRHVRYVEKWGELETLPDSQPCEELHTLEVAAVRVAPPGTPVRCVLDKTSGAPVFVIEDDEVSVIWDADGVPAHSANSAAVREAAPGRRGYAPSMR